MYSDMSRMFESLIIITNIYIALFFEVAQSAALHVHMSSVATIGSTTIYCVSREKGSVVTP